MRKEYPSEDPRLEITSPLGSERSKDEEWKGEAWAYWKTLEPIYYPSSILDIEINREMLENDEENTSYGYGPTIVVTNLTVDNVRYEDIQDYSFKRKLVYTLSDVTGTLYATYKLFRLKRLDDYLFPEGTKVHILGNYKKGELDIHVKVYYIHRVDDGYDEDERNYRPDPVGEGVLVGVR